MTALGDFTASLRSSEGRPRASGHTAEFVPSPKRFTILLVSGQRTVLIVEDDADLRGMFRFALGLAGFTVEEAADGLAALAYLDTHTPDAIVLDLGLPGFGGETVLREIRAQINTCEIPVVIVSGMEKPEDVDFDCFLKKPAPADAILEAIRRCIEARRRGEGRD